MLVIVALGVGQDRSEQDRAANLGQEAPRTEEEGAEAEEQLAHYEGGIEEEDQPARLHREEGKDLERVVQVAETLALSALHGSVEARGSAAQLSMPAMRS